MSGIGRLRAMALTAVVYAVATITIRVPTTQYDTVTTAVRAVVTITLVFARTCVSSKNLKR